MVWDLREGGRLAVGPIAGVLQPGDRRDRGVAAGRDDDAIGLEHLAVDLDVAPPGDPSLAPEDVNTLLAVARDLR